MLRLRLLPIAGIIQFHKKHLHPEIAMGSLYYLIILMMRLPERQIGFSMADSLILPMLLLQKVILYVNTGESIKMEMELYVITTTDNQAMLTPMKLLLLMML